MPAVQVRSGNHLLPLGAERFEVDEDDGLGQTRQAVMRLCLAARGCLLGHGRQFGGILNAKMGVGASPCQQFWSLAIPVTSPRY